LVLFSHSFVATHEIHAAVYNSLLNAARSGQIPGDCIDEAVGRVLALKRRFAITEKPSVELVGHPSHREIMARAARGGITLVRSDEDVFPLRFVDGIRVGVVEFASKYESGVIEQGGMTEFCKFLHDAAPDMEYVAIRSLNPSPESLEHARRLAREVDVLILATRNAHIVQPQLDAARELLSGARQAILLCLRNPYDASVLPQASTVICTCGDSLPSLQAAVEALLGRFTPSGVLPVPLENVT